MTDATARAGGRVAPGVAWVPALVCGGFALPHETVDFRVVRSVRRGAVGLAAVVRVLAVHLLQRCWMVVRPTKVRVQPAAVVVVTARDVRISGVVWVAGYANHRRGQGIRRVRQSERRASDATNE